MASNGDAEERQAMSEAARELERQNVAGRMREAAQAMRQAQPGDDKAPAAAAEIARALDKVGDQLGAASGAQDAESSKLSEQLSRAQELRDRLSRLQRSMERTETGCARCTRCARCTGCEARRRRQRGLVRTAGIIGRRARWLDAVAA